MTTMDAPKEHMGMEVKDLIYDTLRQNYPWMKVEAIEKAVSGCSKLVTNTIEEETPVMQASKERTSFLSLPAEIRNQIYGLALVRRIEDKCDLPLDSVITEECMIDDIDLNDRLAADWIKQPALTRTCRAIRAEALPVYYGKNRFSYLDYLTPCRYILGKLIDGSTPAKTARVFRAAEYLILGQAGNWLQRIGAHNVSMIKHLEIKIYDAKPSKTRRLTPEVVEEYLADTAEVLGTCMRRRDIYVPSQASLSLQMCLRNRRGQREHWEWPLELPRAVLLKGKESQAKGRKSKRVMGSA